MAAHDPVSSLVSEWWRLRDRRPIRYHDVPAARVSLCQAAIETIRAIPGYNPFSDLRVHWASQFLSHIEDPRYAIHDSIACAAEMIFEPRVLCGKDRAAGA